MVAVRIPAPVLGLNLGIAVHFHEGSTLVVVANALRLLAHSDGRSLEENDREAERGPPVFVSS